VMSPRSLALPGVVTLRRPTSTLQQPARQHATGSSIAVTNSKDFWCTVCSPCGLQERRAQLWQ
jgi:hypothetical protein